MYMIWIIFCEFTKEFTHIFVYMLVLLVLYDFIMRNFSSNESGASVNRNSSRLEIRIAQYRYGIIYSRRKVDGTETV